MKNFSANLKTIFWFFHLGFLFYSCHEGAHQSDVSVTPDNTTNSVKIVELFSDDLDKNRKVRILLPQGYESGLETRYPVIYMHDGQNLFDLETAFADEWYVDETLEELDDRRGFKFIVVGIDNGGTERFNEYSPWPNNQFGQAKGEAYARFVINTVKPYVDDKYMTLKDAKNTFMFGSSMGGLITHYFLLEYPDIIGKFGIFSPSYWYSQTVFDQSFKKSNFDTSKIYHYIGGKEGAIMTSLSQQMDSLFITKVTNGNNYQYNLNPVGEHSEKFWAQEFEKALLWMLTD